MASSYNSSNDRRSINSDTGQTFEADDYGLGAINRAKAGTLTEDYFDHRDPEGLTPLHSVLRMGLWSQIKPAMEKIRNVAAQNFKLDPLELLLNQKDKRGWTPFFHAAAGRHLHECLELAQYNAGFKALPARYNASYGGTLPAKDMDPHVYQRQFERQLRQEDHAGNTLLKIVVVNGLLKDLPPYMLKAEDLLIRDQEGTSLLHHICATGQFKHVEHLVSAEMLRMTDSKGRTPVHLAAMNPDPNADDLSRIVAFLAPSADYPMSRELQDCINAKDEMGRTFVHLAATNPESLKKIPTRVLVNSDFGTNGDIMGKTPLILAYESGAVSIMETTRIDAFVNQVTLMRKYPDGEFNQILGRTVDHALCDATDRAKQAYEVAKAEQSVQAKRSSELGLDRADEHGWTQLFHAAWNKTLDHYTGDLTKERLLRRDEEGNTLFMMIAANNYLGKVPQHLITKEMLTLRNTSGETALHHICATGQFKHVEHLVSAEMLRMTDSKGRTPVHLAAMNPDALGQVRDFLTFGNMQDKDEMFRTPCHYAAMSGGTLSQLPASCFDDDFATQQDIYGKTALVHAVECKADQHIPDGAKARMLEALRKEKGLGGRRAVAELTTQKNSAAMHR